MDFREIWCSGMNWLDLVQDRDQWMVFVHTVTNVRAP
jgi:hypothetical protein